MLASDSHEATALIDEMLKTKPRAEVYDGVVIPALTMIEKARYSEEMTPAQAEEVLQGIEELAEDVFSKEGSADSRSESKKRIICVPARDLADEVACQLAVQVLSETMLASVVSAAYLPADLQQSLNDLQPEVICVVGVPPRATRHIRMRCHQIRLRFPDSVVVACVLSDERMLSNLRSRIPTEDAQHVVSSLQLMNEYLKSLLHADPIPLEMRREGRAHAGEISEAVQKMETVNLFDEPEEGIFNRLAMDLARSFDTPIALITVMDGKRRFWEAQCGLPESVLAVTESERDLSICSRITFSDSCLVISDVEQDERFAKDCFLKNNGIRFYAGAPLTSHDGTVIGSACVLDTRPRQLTEQQKKTLIFLANAVMTAIELHSAATPDETEFQPEE
jgi:GAF domain-containing protein